MCLRELRGMTPSPAATLCQASLAPLARVCMAGGKAPTWGFLAPHSLELSWDQLSPASSSAAASERQRERSGAEVNPAQLQAEGRQKTTLWELFLPVPVRPWPWQQVPSCVCGGGGSYLPTYCPPTFQRHTAGEGTRLGQSHLGSELQEDEKPSVGASPTFCADPHGGAGAMLRGAFPAYPIRGGWLRKGQGWCSPSLALSYRGMKNTVGASPLHQTDFSWGGWCWTGGVFLPLPGAWGGGRARERLSAHSR